MSVCKAGLKIFILFSFGFSHLLFADQCPTPEIVKDRKISRAYAWLIDERRTLEEVLAIEKLYSVRIKNKGELVACYYSAKDLILQMDAKPLRAGCIVKDYESQWEVVNSGEQVCIEENVYDCQYAIYCDERSKNLD